MNKGELHQKASAFRSELVKYYARNPDVNHSTNLVNPARGSFPLEHCKAAAFMFGEYLVNHVGVDSDLVSYAWGNRNNQSHGWLIYDGWIIDLTADQFDDVDLNAKLAAWESFYNYDRAHISHDGKTPYEVMRLLLNNSLELTEQTSSD